MSFIDAFKIETKQRIVGLDILRATAILLVVYNHGALLLPESMRLSYFKYSINIDGVSIFLVLSGYLIGGILIKLILNTDFSRAELLNFWIRRWFRTIPNYVLVLTLLLVYQVVVFKNLNSFSIKYFFFLQNFNEPHPKFFPEAWSLSIEEWFYLLFPLICYFLHKIWKNKYNAILYSALIFLVVPLILRVIKYELNLITDFDGEFRKIVVMRLDSLMFGVMAAYVSFVNPLFWKKSKYICLFIGALLGIAIQFNFIFYWVNLYRPIFFNLESISVMLLLPFFSQVQTTKIRILNSFIIFISVISYSMYLLNLTPIISRVIPVTNNLLGLTKDFLEKAYLIDYLLYWFYTITLSYLLFGLFEIRITKLRDKVISRKITHPIIKPVS